jgi:hypothetical protein
VNILLKSAGVSDKPNPIIIIAKPKGSKTTDNILDCIRIHLNEPLNILI